MNSINKDTDASDNTEANNFVIVDRYMSGFAWDEAATEKSNTKVKFEDKIDKLYWRGAPSSAN